MMRTDRRRVRGIVKVAIKVIVSSGTARAVQVANIAAGAKTAAKSSARKEAWLPVISVLLFDIFHAPGRSLTLNEGGGARNFGLGSSAKFRVRPVRSCQSNLTTNARCRNSRRGPASGLWII